MNKFLQLVYSNGRRFVPVMSKRKTKKSKCSKFGDTGGTCYCLGCNYMFTLDECICGHTSKSWDDDWYCRECASALSIKESRKEY